VQRGAASSKSNACSSNTGWLVTMVSGISKKLGGGMKILKTATDCDIALFAILWQSPQAIQRRTGKSENTWKKKEDRVCERDPKKKLNK
jgi:hypothetical protein